jgi:hypothetical protein
MYSQFVLLLVGQLTEVDSLELGTDRRGQVLDPACSTEESLLLRIGVQATVRNSNVSEWLPLNLWEPRL